MSEDKILTDEMIQHRIDMKARGYHEEASRLYQAKLEGKKEGKKEEKISIVKNLLKINIPVEAISQSTGLSVEEVEELKKII